MTAQAQPFRPRVVAALVVVGLAAFAALLLLVAFRPNVGAGTSGRAHALSSAATGYKGLVTLMERVGPVRMVRDSEDIFRDNLLVVAFEERSRPEALTQLLERRGARPTLVILSKWATMPHPSRRGWVTGVFPGASGGAGEALGARVEVERASTPSRRVRGEGMLAGIEAPVPPRAQLITGKAITPLLALPGGALVAQVGDQPHFVLADPDLVNNHGLRTIEGATAAVALLEALNPTGTTGVDFDLTVNGLGSKDERSVLRLAFEPPFLAMTLALFVAAVLAGLHGAVRFGPVAAARRAIAFGKAALVENSAGLLRLARREARLGAAYAEVVRQEAARATAAPPGLRGEPLDAYLDRVGRSSGRDFTELAAALAAARDRHGLMAAVRAMNEWRRAVIR